MFFCRKEKDELARLREELERLKELYESLRRQYDEVLYRLKKKCYVRSIGEVSIGTIYMPIIVESTYDFPIYVKKVDVPLVLRNNALCFQVPAEKGEWTVAAAAIFLMRSDVGKKTSYTLKYATRYLSPTTK